MALELLLLLVLLVATLLLRDGDLLTVLLLVLLVAGLFATDLCVLVVLCTFLLWVLFSGFLYVFVLLVTVLVRGVLVTVLLVTAFRCGDLTVVDLLFTALRCGDLTVEDLLVTDLLVDDLVSFLRIDLLSMLFDLSTAVLPATFPFERLERVPEFLATSFLLVLDLFDFKASLYRVVFRLLRTPSFLRLRFSRCTTRLSFLYIVALSRRTLLYLCSLPILA